MNLLIKFFLQILTLFCYVLECGGSSETELWVFQEGSTPWTSTTVVGSTTPTTLVNSLWCSQASRAYYPKLILVLIFDFPIMFLCTF